MVSTCKCHFAICAPEHRIEFVRSVGGVSFYDDSKATNPDSTIVALEAFQEPVVVILGGRNKGYGFCGFGRVHKAKVHGQVGCSYG